MLKTSLNHCQFYTYMYNWYLCIQTRYVDVLLLTTIPSTNEGTKGSYTDGNTVTYRITRHTRWMGGGGCLLCKVTNLVLHTTCSFCKCLWWQIGWNGTGCGVRDWFPYCLIGHCDLPSLLWGFPCHVSVGIECADLAWVWVFLVRGKFELQALTLDPQAYNLQEKKF